MAIRPLCTGRKDSPAVFAAVAAIADRGFALPDGVILGPQVSTSEIDGEFADAWRVTATNSLFSTAVPEPST
jgi:hypothetical protein